MSKENIVVAFDILNNAKLTKLETSDKFILIKIIREFKKISDEFNELKDDVLKRFAGEDHDQIIAKAKQWQQEGSNTTISNEDKIIVNTYLNKYQNDVNQCLKTELCKDVEITCDNLSKSAFESLVASNDWTAQQIILLEDIITNE